MPFDFLHKDAARLLTLPGLAVCASWDDETLTGVRSTMKRQDAATLNGDLVKYDFSLRVPASEVQRVGACPVPLRDLLVGDGVSHLVLVRSKSPSPRWTIRNTLPGRAPLPPPDSRGLAESLRKT